jgi:hypothetical protein
MAVQPRKILGEAAARIGRTEGAVTEKRHRLRIPTADDRRRLNGRRH